MTAIKKKNVLRKKGRSSKGGKGVTELHERKERKLSYLKENFKKGWREGTRKRTANEHQLSSDERDDPCQGRNRCGVKGRGGRP